MFLNGKWNVNYLYMTNQKLTDVIKTKCKHQEKNVFIYSSIFPRQNAYRMTARGEYEVMEEKTWFYEVEHLSL